MNCGIKNCNGELILEGNLCHICLRCRVCNAEWNYFNPEGREEE